MDIKSIFRNHFHIIMFTYFWIGLAICGLYAPEERVLLLESSLIKEGWHLSILSLLTIAPVVILYLVKHKKSQG